jgi:protein-export membrane protein SecD
MRSDNARLIVILMVLVACGYWLYPVYKWSRMTPEDVAANPERAEDLRSRSINLGLDLQGGIHMVLGIKTEKLKQNILLAATRRGPQIFKDRGITVLGARVVGDAVEFEVNPAARTERADDVREAVRIIGYLNDPDFVDDPARPDRAVVRAELDRAHFEREIREATGRALEIIRNRIDAFGVAEPSIQQVGDRKIVVELPGAADPARARKLIGRTAQLQFHRVRDDAELSATLSAMDAALGGELIKRITVQTLGEGHFDIHLKAEEKDRVVELLGSPAAEERLPAGTRVFLGSVSERSGAPTIPLYLLEEIPAMTGENLEMARIFYDERNRPAVTFEFNSEGAEQFGALTSELMRGQKRLAIVLDDVVQSAPSVKSRITARGEISGSFTHEEARDLAVVLRSGALPAPVEILEDRTVGPSLGRDSIRKGMIAAALGFAVTALFMVGWYRVSGLIAVTCLFLNLVMILAVLAAIGATLTLPGIAGIVLVIGMAVDANILIFERMKEELRAGKGVFSAINAGYEKAFSTIFDANVTTLITAAALYEYGTGPIRGFAVTLAIGIVASMFSAIFISRTIFNKFVLNAREPRLSI